MLILSGVSEYRNYAFAPYLSNNGPVRDVRTSQGVGLDDSGRQTLQAQATVRISETGGRTGFLAEDTRTNYIARSSEPLQWTKSGTATSVVSPQPDGCPFGSPVRIVVGSGSANKVTTPATTGQPVSTAFVASLYMRRVSTSGILVVEFGNSQGRFEIDLSLVPDGWQFITSTHPSVTSTPVALTTAAGAASIDLALYGKTSTVTVDVSHVQAEAGTIATSPIPTTTTQTARGRSWPVVTAPNFTSAGVTFGARYTRHAGTADVTFGLGDAASTAGNNSIIVTDAGSTIRVSASTGANAPTVSANVNVDVNVLHRAVAVVATTSTVKLFLNGVEVASINVALGTGIPYKGTASEFWLPRSSTGPVVTHRAMLIQAASSGAATSVIGSLA